MTKKKYDTKPPRVLVTSAKLSRKLLAAGLDTSGAEHHYFIPYDSISKRPGAPKFRTGPCRETTKSANGREVPAWTCGALADAARHVTDQKTVDTLLEQLDGSATREMQTIARIGDLILDSIKQGNATRTREVTINRTGWPTEQTNRTSKEPFRKRLSAWWRERPWR